MITPDTINHPFPNLSTLPLLEEAGWKGVGTNLAGSLFGWGSAYLKLDKPDENGNAVLLILKDPEVKEDQLTPPQFICVGVQYIQYLSELYPDVDWEPWEQRAFYHEAIDGPYDQVREQLLRLIREHGWSKDLKLEDLALPYDRFEIRDPKRRYGSRPAPGETVEQYEDRLLWGNPDTGEDSVICRDFKRDPYKVWFVSGGSECFGQELCQWHSGMDAIYAAGFSTIANVGVPLDVLEGAISLMRRNAEASSKEHPYEAAHARCLLRVMEAALQAKPGDEVQSYEG